MKRKRGLFGPISIGAEKYWYIDLISAPLRRAHIRPFTRGGLVRRASKFEMENSGLSIQANPVPPQKSLRYDYTKGSISRGIARLGAPIFGESVAFNTDSLVEVFWVGHLGPEYLAAMALSFMLFMFVKMMTYGIRIVGQALVAQRIGKGDEEGAALMAGQAIAISFVLSLTITFLCLWFTPWIISLMTSDPRLFRLGVAYLYAIFAFFVVIDAGALLGHLLRGAGEAGYAFMGTAAGTIVTFMCMPLFIFGAGAVPRLELAGVGVAVGLGRIAGLAVVFFLILTGRTRLPLRFRHLRPRVEWVKLFASLAWPVSTQNVLEGGVNLVLLRMLSAFGPFVLAAWGIGNRVVFVARQPGFVLQVAVRTMVGQNLGANLPERAKLSIRTSLIAAIVLSVITTTIVFVWAPAVVAFFGMKGEAALVGTLCLRILIWGVVFETAFRVLTGAFQGAANTKPPMIADFAGRGGILLPGAYLVSAVFGYGAAGIWWMVVGSQLVGFASLIFWFHAKNPLSRKQ